MQKGTEHKKTRDDVLKQIAAGTAPTLEDYKTLISGTKCRWCGAELKGDVKHRDFGEGGWIVEGFKERQWLWIRCPGCKYDWALWKLLLKVRSEVIKMWGSKKVLD